MMKGGDIVQNKENSTLENKTLKTRKRIAIIAIAVMLCICTLSLSVVFAKYVNEKNSTAKLGRQSFISQAIF